MKESVWDYPRPPRVEDSGRRIRVEFAGIVIAETIRSKRVLETSHPPVYYIPPQDVRAEMLTQTDRRSWCEWKGVASYFDLKANKRISENACWSYLKPNPEFESILGYFAFYVSRVDACFVDSEKVAPQPGDFYGGWITSDIVGPFKGGPGSSHW